MVHLFFPKKKLVEKPEEIPLSSVKCSVCSRMTTLGVMKTENYPDGRKESQYVCFACLAKEKGWQVTEERKKK